MVSHGARHVVRCAIRVSRTCVYKMTPCLRVPTSAIHCICPQRMEAYGRILITITPWAIWFRMDQTYMQYLMGRSILRPTRGIDGQTCGPMQILVLWIL